MGAAQPVAELDLGEECLPRLGHVPECLDGLLIQLDHLAMRRACAGFVSGEPSVPHRFLPLLPAVRVMRKWLELLVAIAVDGFERADDLRVECAASLAEQAAVGHLVGQRVLERVLGLGEEARFIEELGGLQASQPTAQVLLGQLGNDEQESERHVLADDGSSLEELLVPGSQPVDPRGKDRLHRGGHVDRVEAPGEAMGPARPREDVRLDQRPHALLKEERIATGASDEDWFERLNRGVGSQQGQEQLAGALGRQRVQTELGVVRLAPPAMLVLAAGS